MDDKLKELKEIFPSSKEVVIAGKTFIVKPMVWTDFLVIINDIGKVLAEISKDNFNLTEFDEKKDFPRLIPVINEILNIFARWLGAESEWLKNNLTPKGTMQLVLDFLEVNEWSEVKSLFLAVKLKAQNMEEK